MFLLLLIDLGTASVKAQVRIGGNTSPNAATVLDLNTNNNANPAGNKGLGLPRVSLANDTTMLTPGVANLNGMMVCNTTNNTVGGVGLYYWSANFSKWVKVNLPPTSAADSGKFLMSNGSTAIWTYPTFTGDPSCTDTIRNLLNINVTWQRIIDTAIYRVWLPNRYYVISVPGLRLTDICISGGHGLGGDPAVFPYGVFTWDNYLRIYVPAGSGSTQYRKLRCYRPSV